MAKLNFNKRKYGKFATCLNKTIGFFARKATFEFLTEKPDEPCIILCNHTTLQAPFAYELFYGDKLNFWSNAKLRTYKDGIDHFKNVLAKVTKLGFLMPLAYILMPPQLRYHSRLARHARQGNLRGDGKGVEKR